ncbi:MAG: linear amide C-N hydrolase [Armatimonadetes bacterium]|nr:linear amide C-N hydrolase [Armatimonadota bacterium]
MRIHAVTVTFALSTASLLFATACTPGGGPDKVVAGAASDFMIVRSLRVEGTQEEIGQQLGRIASKNHGVDKLEGEGAPTTARLDWLKANWPEQYRRSQGLARLWKVSGSDGKTDTTELPYDMGFAPACSTVFYPGSSVKNGHAMLSRNYDFSLATYAELTGRKAKPGQRAMTADPYVIESRPKDGYASLYVCAYDLLAGCIDGINEKGVAVALLADDMAESHVPTTGPGLTEVTLTRFVLDRCASAKEARKLLESAAYHYSFVPCHYMVCDASGDSFIWEISPDLKQRWMVPGEGKPQIVTNHRVSKYGTAKLPDGNSFDRFRRLQQEIAKKGGLLTPDEVRETNLCVAVPPVAAQAATLWHSVYDLKERTLKVSFFLGREDGKDRRTPYLEFRLAER